VYFVQLRIAKVKQTTTNRIDSTYPHVGGDGGKTHRKVSFFQTGALDSGSSEEIPMSIADSRVMYKTSQCRYPGSLLYHAESNYRGQSHRDPGSRADR
ncbi:MAG: hypothetical protein MZU91_04690, partial [Desulfosudis oleivorans]|nr:hypothetical protein [Desulfosudis oleivorans]